jgi:hypothetical protein
MKITVFGGSGAMTVGRWFVSEALSRGQRFHVPRHDRLTVTLGDAMDLDAVKSVMDADTDVVVTSIGGNTLAYNTGKTCPSHQHVFYILNIES